MTVSISQEVLEQARVCSYWCRTTLSELVESALKKEVSRLRKKENDGEPFSLEDVKLKSGRPMKHK